MQSFTGSALVVDVLDAVVAGKIPRRGTTVERVDHYAASETAEGVVGNDVVKCVGPKDHSM